MTGEPTLSGVRAAFARWLIFPKNGAGACYDQVDVALAVIVANRMEGDPLWVFFVAPPSSGKTEILRSLSNVPDVYPLSSLTAQTFVSGFEKKGAETSLLPKITGKVITMKDFGTVLQMYYEKRAEILGQLREIYDGSYVKEFGNGKKVQWDGKVGLLAGCTPIIDQGSALNAALGERFLIYRIKTAPARDFARQAMAQQQTYETERRQTLRAIVAGFLETLLPAPPPMPEPITEGIAALAEFAAAARSPVLWDRQNTIELIPEPEAPGRLAKQLRLLTNALAVVRGEREVSLSSFATTMQVAQDSMPAQRRLMLEVVLRREASDPPTTTDVAEATDYPTTSARRYLQELAAVRLITRRSAESHGLADRWAPSDKLIALLEDIRRPMRAEECTRKIREGEVSERIL